MEHYRSVGYFRTTPRPYADLGAIVAGLAPGRERDGERILTINLGIAAEDMAVASLVDRRARQRGVGTELPR
jgi:ornithine cyclodeaminase/alanine dehydrogenase